MKVAALLRLSRASLFEGALEEVAGDCNGEGGCRSWGCWGVEVQ